MNKIKRDSAHVINVHWTSITTNKTKRDSAHVINVHWTYITTNKTKGGLQQI